MLLDYSSRLLASKINKRHIGALYYQENREKILAQAATYYRNNSESIKAYGRDYYYQHREARIAQATTYNREHADAHAKRVRKYHASPAGRAMQARARTRRRSLEAQTLNTLTADEWQHILAIQESKCACCGAEFDERITPERDHILPITLGGGLTADNTQALCKRCNVIKGNKHIDYRN